MIRVAVLSLALGLAYGGLGKIQKISTLTSICEDCDMTLLGQVNVKVCGGVPGSSCCSVVNIGDFDNGRFNQGVIDDFAGKHQLEDCYNYDLAKVSSPADLNVTVYHEGSDGGQLDWIEVHTESKTVRCYLGVWMDSFSHVKGQCQLVV